MARSRIRLRFTPGCAIQRGAVTTYHYGAGGDSDALVRLSTGIYYIDVTVDLPGEWYYGFYSTGNAQGASPDTKMNVLETVR